MRRLLHSSRIILLYIFTSSVFAKDIVLVSSFDPFGRSEKNNSEVVMNLLQKSFLHHDSIDLITCNLNTVFDKAFKQLVSCIDDLESPPKMILMLGESGCHFKAETMVKNLDLTFGPDNEGQERSYTKIISSAADFLGLHYPLSNMYCSLNFKERSLLHISNNAGSFVCNNTAYQMRHFFPLLNFGLIHVPSHDCPDLQNKNETISGILKKMIESKSWNTEFTNLLITKKELKNKIKSNEKKSCYYEFYQKSKNNF